MKRVITNPVFINTGDTSLDLSGIDTDHYSLEAVIRACDSPYVVFSRYNETTNEKVVEAVSFILRTFKGNKLVANTKSNRVVFEIKAYDKLPEGITLNDFMLFSAKEFLTQIIYPKYDNKDIAINAVPTPFGIIQRADNTNEALFQIVVNNEVLTELNDGYSYVAVEEYKNDRDFHKIYQQFKFTRED